MKAHGAQLRDNGDPYITHPLAVADILAGYRLDTSTIVTALLHDVLEDTSISSAELGQRFGKEVAGLVDGVTKLTRLELQSDRTKQAENFRKLVLAMSRDIRVLLVKLADRLHNMRTIHYITSEARRRPHRRRDDGDLRAARRAHRHGRGQDRAPDPGLRPARAGGVRHHPGAAELSARAGGRHHRGCRRRAEARLRRLGSGRGRGHRREKSPYSIWQKMQRRSVAFEQLSDIMAFRLVVQTRESCYAALGAVHSAYQVIAGRFKDYISTPKANGYQSLHTGVTLREPSNQKIEVQIRTPEMHNVADNGVAAHWSYKVDARCRPRSPRRSGSRG